MVGATHDIAPFVASANGLHDYLARRIEREDALLERFGDGAFQETQSHFFNPLLQSYRYSRGDVEQVVSSDGRPIDLEMGDVAEIRTFLGRAAWVFVRIPTKVFDVSVEDIYGGGKSRPRAKARSLFCHWATHELAIAAIELARLPKLDQSSVSKAALRGEHLSRELGVTLEPPKP